MLSESLCGLTDFQTLVVDCPYNRAQFTLADTHYSIHYHRTGTYRLQQAASCSSNLLQLKRLLLFYFVFFCFLSMLASPGQTTPCHELRVSPSPRGRRPARWQSVSPQRDSVINSKFKQQGSRLTLALPSQMINRRMKQHPHPSHHPTGRGQDNSLQHPHSTSLLD